MDQYFVRVYTMNDGSKVEVDAIYQTYQQAEEALPLFKTDSDSASVLFAQVEKRFSPRKIWEQAA